MPQRSSVEVLSLSNAIRHEGVPAVPSCCPTDEQVKTIENKVNEVIDAAMPVTIEYMSRGEAAAIVDLSKLSEDASETLRIVRVGDYDDCACIGAHVANTSEIGEYRGVFLSGRRVLRLDIFLFRNYIAKSSAFGLMSDDLIL